jgi:hypothetical protein
MYARGRGVTVGEAQALSFCRAVIMSFVHVKNVSTQTEVLVTVYPMSMPTPFASFSQIIGHVMVSSDNTDSHVLRVANLQCAYDLHTLAKGTVPVPTNSTPNDESGVTAQVESRVKNHDCELSRIGPIY